MNEKKEIKNNKAEEPEITYKKKGIRFFSNFEEAEEAEAIENARLTPVEHMQWTTGLIERLYADKIAGLTRPYKEIIFVEYAYLY